MKSVLVDTSFCIRLLDKTDPLHANAKSYYKHFLEKKIKVILSSIVIAEYTVKGEYDDLPIKNMQMIHFDHNDAKKAGEFHGIISKRNDKKEIHKNAGGRNVIKNDCKLIAQVASREIDSYITTDVSSLNSMIIPIKKEYPLNMEFIDLNIPCHIYLGKLLDI